MAFIAQLRFSCNMKDVVDLTLELRQKSAAYGNELATLHSIQTNEMPAGVFGMIFNKLTLLAELLDNYYKIWNDPQTKVSTSIDEAKAQNGERVIMIQRMVFTEIISSIELCSKNLFLANPNLLGGPINGRIYIRKILERSKDAGILTDEQLTLWKAIIELRNTVVHNNGTAENSESYSFPNCTLTFNSGQMTQGDLKLFPNLTDWTLDSFRQYLVDHNVLATS